MTDTALELLIEQGVTTVRLAYSGLHGIARGKEFPAGYFETSHARRRAALRGDHDGRPAAQRDLRVSSTGSRTSWPARMESTLARLPWDPEVAWMIGDLERMDGSPYGVDSRAVAEAGDRQVRRARTVAGDGPRARVLPVRARPVGAAGLPPLRRQPQPRVHRRRGGRSARDPAADDARRGRARPGCVCCQPRVRPVAVRDQPDPQRRAERGRSRVHVQGDGQGDGRGRGPAGDVHRQAVERRRGLGLPPALLAGGRRRRQPAGRRERAGWAVRAGPAVSGGRARARPVADGVPQPDHQRLPPDHRDGAGADAGELGARQPPVHGARAARARRGDPARGARRRRRRQRRTWRPRRC